MGAATISLWAEHHTGREWTTGFASAESPKRYRPQVEFVAEKLANKRVADLERLATALYVSVDSRVTPGERASKIHALKPHVSLQEACDAVEEIDGIRADAELKQLIVEQRLTADGR